MTAYELARAEIGTKEVPGSAHNQAVVDYFAEVGHSWVQDDETAWCAAFVGAMLKRAGMPQTGKLNARSYLDWGQPVDPDQAKPGDVVVFWRGDKNGWQGHVGFFVRRDGGQIIVLGGNQSNRVSEAGYAASRLLGVRRIARKPVAKSTTMQAAAGAAVSGASSAAYAIGQLDSTAQAVVIAGAVLAGLCLLWIMRERIKKLANGI
jgi:uncharacterized protein (TIGR02594 family)